MSGDPPQTYLFVPGNRPERFAKALASGADRVILDLEDAVAPGDKAAARDAVVQWMTGAGEAQGKVLIRINDDATPWHLDDLALMRAVQPACVMLPKCETAAQVAAVLASLAINATVLPLIETARGVMGLPGIAAAPGVACLAFGSLDYMVDLNIPADSLALDFAASQIAIASRAAGLNSPVAGVTPALDAAQVSADMRHARSLGFGAKMCIHPAQVAAVRAALAPSAEERAWAQRVLQAWQACSTGALQLDGKMIDRPVVLKAERIAAQAARTDSSLTP
ncbi:HpcH/HpaI aldolase/citrate lyase family protein [Polaromonas glacialis]|uniref:HpcH/HpaI aldolase/citrate lyase family protein n=1 Tax=Polaromonas glacialis TaxID=866564 RepID=UPI00049652A0|nr:CoA ester lyase [Polaromonas glacialis]